MWPSPSHFQCLRRPAIVAVMLCAMLPALPPEPAQAQEPPQGPPVQGGTPQGQPTQNAPAQEPKPYGGGSPFDVLLHAKLWETPPEAKAFVKESRQPSSELDYQPTAGTDDVKRPKLLSPGQLKALQGTLEQAGAHNEKAAGVKDSNFADVATGKADKGKSRRARAERSKAKMPIQLHKATVP